MTNILDISPWMSCKNCAKLFWFSLVQSKKLVHSYWQIFWLFWFCENLLNLHLNKFSQFSSFLLMYIQKLRKWLYFFFKVYFILKNIQKKLITLCYISKKLNEFWFFLTKLNWSVYNFVSVFDQAPTFPIALIEVEKPAKHESIFFIRDEIKSTFLLEIFYFSINSNMHKK